MYVIRASQNDWKWPPFEPLAMLGGFLWCTGTLFSKPAKLVVTAPSPFACLFLHLKET